ncbi:hypothetical protein BDF20DRAFT_833430 [Mycotypha africana]|uniref:uncharacterized protein n=1 Tax=Mycotypha africana TaxID=64632 RepID=UPI002301B4C7|nr:uncharacterized protein BDF20DRAFT_833430 [Mycotypha africana]KAI8988596.1 hypothetical protein BDF20DRAFT_833430 [Mycotypha africana]
MLNDGNHQVKRRKATGDPHAVTVNEYLPPRIHNCCRSDTSEALETVRDCSILVCKNCKCSSAFKLQYNVSKIWLVLFICIATLSKTKAGKTVAALCIWTFQRLIHTTMELAKYQNE